MIVNDPVPPRHQVTAQREATCEKHGAFTQQQWSMVPPSKHKAKLFDPFWSKCPKCDAEIQHEQNQAAERRCSAERMKQLRNEAANIPSRFHDATLWNWQHLMDKQRICWDWAVEYAKHFDVALHSGRSGVFVGTHGTGKSSLAIGVLHHVLEKGGTGHYDTVVDALARIKATFREGSGDSEERVVGALCRVDLLVLDELGRSFDTPWERTTFFRILDRRYANQKPTLLVSNLSKDELGEFLGAGVVDRIMQSGGKVLVFDWESQRGKRKPDA
jgi:DNA replication protein DnaC